jgi:osmotically-inducible protein OsmY
MEEIRTDPTPDLRREVLSELEWDPRIDASGIGVMIDVDPGVVTLTGWVKSFGERWAAEEAALRVRGCRGVANELEVRLPLDSQRTDPEIAAAAVRALESIAGFDAEEIRVSVSDGFIVLRGVVDVAFQRHDAELAVRNLWGVRGVTNQIAVREQIH